MSQFAWKKQPENKPNAENPDLAIRVLHDSKPSLERKQSP
jgi:hypothetical protein